MCIHDVVPTPFPKTRIYSSPLRTTHYHPPGLMQMTRGSEGAGSAWNPTRGRISLSSFLYLAMVCFVSPNEPTENAQQQQQQQTSRPLKERMSAVGPGGRRLYVRDRSGPGAGNNPCTNTTTTGWDGSVAALSPPSTPTRGGRNAFRDSSGAAEAREDGTASPASVSFVPRKSWPLGVLCQVAASRTQQPQEEQVPPLAD